MGQRHQKSEAEFLARMQDWGGTCDETLLAVSFCHVMQCGLRVTPSASICIVLCLSATTFMASGLNIDLIIVGHILMPCCGSVRAPSVSILFLVFNNATLMMSSCFHKMFFLGLFRLTGSTKKTIVT